MEVHADRRRIMKRVLKGLAIAACFASIWIWNGLTASSQEPATKYGRYVHTTDIHRKIAHYTGTSIVAREGQLEGNVSFTYHCLAKPINFDKPHTHDFEETLCFIGGNPLDITDFKAVVEYTIDGEKHVLTQPGCVSMPKGLVHCPVKVSNVSPEKPIVFIEVSATRSYGQPKMEKPAGEAPPQPK